MKGITILNSYNAFDFGQLLFIAIICGALIGVGWWAISKRKENFGWIGVVIGIIGIITAIISYRVNLTRYEVLIDETVPFVEFHEKYEVIDERGDIFIIEEK